MRNERVIVVWRKCHSLKVDTAAKWVRMLRRFVIWAWIDYECSTSTTKFTPFTKIFFLLNKICDGGSSNEPFLVAATLSILIWAYPRETKTNNGKFKNAIILSSKVAYRWRACALILPLCPRSVENFYACAMKSYRIVVNSQMSRYSHGSL